MKSVKTLLLITSLAAFGLTLFNCGTDNTVWTDDGSSNNLSASTLKTDYQAYEIATLSLTSTIDAGDYSGGIDSVALSLKAEDSLAWFMVPNLNEGYYDGWLAIDGDTVWYGFNVLPNQITDPDAAISNFINEQADLQKELDAYVDSLILDSMPGFEDALADKQVWAQIAEAANTEIENLDEEGKMALAQLLDANKGLIEELDNMIIGSLPGFKRSTKKQCEALIAQGKKELKEGDKWASIGTRVSAYWCSVKYVSSHKDAKVTKKIWVLFDNAVLGPGMFVLNTITSFVGRKLDCLTKEIQEITNKKGIADLLEELEEAKKQKVLNFRNGEPEALIAKIKFRSIGSDDRGTEGPIGGTADFFEELIGVYNKMVEVSEQPLVWRPGFEPKRYAVRKFNRFLSIDGASVSNSDIALINTQIRNDVWEAAFGNDGNEEEPEFTFELVYDDGEVQLSHTVNAKIADEVAFNFEGSWRWEFINYNTKEGREDTHYRTNFSLDKKGVYYDYYSYTYVRSTGKTYTAELPGRTLLVYEDGKIILPGTSGGPHEVVVKDPSDDVFYSENWDSTYDKSAVYNKYRLTRY